MKMNKKIAILAILTIIPVLILAGCWTFLTVNVPYWDDYGVFIKYFTEPWPDRWAHLFDFHNEHRIVTTRLIADALVFVNGGSFNFRTMIAIGNAMQLSYALIWLCIFKRSRLGISAGIPILWMLTSFIHYENSCWALCSVQNVLVMALMFISCLLFAERKSSRLSFSFSLFAGIAATFSSGCGLLIWPSLIGMELADPITKRGSWSKGLQSIPSHIKGNPLRFAILTVVATASICCYLHDFPDGTSGHTNDIMQRLFNGILFFLAFTGGIIPVFSGALILGCVFLPIVIFITVRYPKLHHPEIFWFMIAGIATIFSASVFRSSNPYSAVSSRYCIVSCSVFASMLFLGLEQLPISKHLANRLLFIMTAGTIIYTTAFLALGAPLFVKRNELMRRNILTWPAHIDGLRSASPETDSVYLLKCVNRGVYNPVNVILPNEKPPQKPLPWLR